jgi:hypothetical protein
VPESQARIIAALNSLDYHHVVNTLPALLIDEYGAENMDSAKAVPQRRGKKNKSTAAEQAATSTKGNINNAKAATSLSSASNGYNAGDGWEETLREDFDGFDVTDHTTNGLPWRTQTETQVEDTLQDADFPSDSESEVSTTRSGRKRSHRGLESEIQVLGALSQLAQHRVVTRGTGTQVDPQGEMLRDSQSETQREDTLMDGQPSQTVTSLFSPLKTRHARKTQAENSTSSAAPIATATPTAASSAAVASAASRAGQSTTRTQGHSDNHTAASQSHSSSQPSSSSRSKQLSFPVASPAKPPAVPKRAGKRGRGVAGGTQLVTLHESAEDDASQPAAAASQVEPEGPVRALYDKLTRLTERQPSDTPLIERPSQASGASLPLSSATQASPESQQRSASKLARHAASVARGQSSEVKALHTQVDERTTQAQLALLTSSSASAPGGLLSQTLTGSGPTAGSHNPVSDGNTGWLDRTGTQNLITQEERDVMFDWLSSQPASQFLFPLPASHAASSASQGEPSSAEAGVVGSAAVCEEEGPVDSSADNAGTGADAGASASPGLFRTQLTATARHQGPTPSRPTKSAPVESSSQTRSNQHHTQHHQQASQSASSSSYRSPSSQGAQVVMINHNDSASNQMMTKTGKLFAFRPPESKCTIPAWCARGRGVDVAVISLVSHRMVATVAHEIYRVLQSVAIEALTFVLCYFLCLLSGEEIGGGHVDGEYARSYADCDGRAARRYSGLRRVSVLPSSSVCATLQ